MVGDSDTHGAAGDAGKDLSKDEDAADGAGPGRGNLMLDGLVRSGNGPSVDTVTDGHTVGDCQRWSRSQRLSQMVAQPQMVKDGHAVTDGQRRS